MLICSCINMRKFWQNNTTIQEEDGEIENMSAKLRQSLAELECEEAIIEDKERFGRVRNSMMKVLRTKYGYEIADRALSRVNKRIHKNYLQS